MILPRTGRLRVGRQKFVDRKTGLRSLAFALVAVLVSASGCRKDQNPNPGPVPTHTAGPRPEPTYSPQPGACYIQKHIQPKEEPGHKVDLLFVIDTSGSMTEDRRRVAEGIDEFVSEIPEDADYRMGVMMAHGSTSSYTGELWRHRWNKHVLKSAEMDLEDIREQLSENLIHAPYDGRQGTGEAGLYALTQALESKNLKSSRKKGFFREDAALAVVFISDENDLCAAYPPGVTPVPDETGTEAIARARDCRGITPQSVLNAVKSVQGSRPFVIAGIVYDDATKVPTKGPNNSVTQEEYGWGYMELIALSQGISIDFGGKKFEEGLGKIGRLVSARMNPRTEFILERGQDIDPSTIHVLVDGKTVPHTYDSSLRLVRISKRDAGKADWAVVITYCDKKPPVPTTTTSTTSTTTSTTTTSTTTTSTSTTSTTSTTTTTTRPTTTTSTTTTTTRPTTTTSTTTTTTRPTTTTSTTTTSTTTSTTTTSTTTTSTTSTTTTTSTTVPSTTTTTTSTTTTTTRPPIGT